MMELVIVGYEDGGSDGNSLHLLSLNHMPGTVQSTFKCINLHNTKSIEIGTLIFLSL